MKRILSQINKSRSFTKGAGVLASGLALAIGTTAGAGTASASMRFAAAS
jgi:hypothetical protein